LVMMNNKMEEVAKILGKELEEEFGIEGRRYNYRITTQGLEYYRGFWILSSDDILRNLLTGALKIKWTPKNGESVWTLETYSSTPSLSKYKKNWSGSELQHKRGLKFKSEEKAIEKMKELGWL